MHWFDAATLGARRRLKPRRARADDRPWPYPRWIAHRGAGKLAPENTLAAFRVGARHGYRAFECDVKLAADGVPFLLHDATLQRTTSGHGAAGGADLERAVAARRRQLARPRLRRRAAAELRRGGALLPRNGFALNVEIKPSPGAERETGRVVADGGRARSGPARRRRRCSARSSPTRSHAAREAAPALPRALLLDSLRAGWLDEAHALGCVAVVTALRADGRRRARARCTAPACARLVYTVNDPAEAQPPRALGIDGIITDAVDRFAPGAAPPTQPRAAAADATGSSAPRTRA